MAEIKLSVPKVAQALEMSCWYAAACMVSYYYRIGPRIGLPDVWQANNGILPADLGKLARKEGLMFLDSAGHKFTAASMIATISKYGPIWTAGNWFGAGHAIVLTGADDQGLGNIYFNDPDGGVAKTNVIPWYNSKAYPGLMLVKDQSQY